ncbi:cerebellin-2-like [Saccostrea echinata]|uniref:cerebellin-2-like n=1 Tax=Saccostrea echinata TaxID=191078 RepID=UPI002A7FEFEB|nr:cerebellin-2-like [Saccostrea echinata]
MYLKLKMNLRIELACLIIFGCLVTTMASEQLGLTTGNSKNVSETHFSKDKLLSEALDQLYKETMIRLEIEKRLRILTEEVSNLKDGYEKLCETMPTERENTTKGNLNSAVGFSAILTKDTNLGDSQIVKYDNVITNYGDGYDKWTGIFTAPMEGLYVFSCTIMAYDKNSIHIQIVQGGRVISTIHSDSTPWNQASETVVLVLKRGDNVWTRQTGHGHRIHGDYNLFSGFLISTQI